MSGQIFIFCTKVQRGTFVLGGSRVWENSLCTDPARGTLCPPLAGGTEVKDLLGKERSWAVIPTPGTFALFYATDFVKCLLSSLETVGFFLF